MQTDEIIGKNAYSVLWKKTFGWKGFFFAAFSVLCLLMLIVLVLDFSTKKSPFDNKNQEIYQKNLWMLVGWMVVSGSVFIYCLTKYLKAKKDIFLLAQELTGAKSQPLVIYSKAFHKYRFPDLFKFLQMINGKDSEWVMLNSMHFESLQGIMSNRFYAPQNRIINPSEMLNWKVGPGKTEPIPKDVFLFLPNTREHAAQIIRVHMDADMNYAILDLAVSENEVALNWMDQMEDYFQTKSIYKNHTVQFFVQFNTIETTGIHIASLTIEFVEKPIVRDEDIILDAETHEVLERCVVDFHNRREELIKYGLNGRRGLIFYGPPGTGKTYTCRYLASKMKDNTAIVVSGSALANPRHFCELAKKLQPSLVILEDVDLVYGNRERNFNVAALGDLMDELDGFGNSDKAIFILTTNSIDRVEDAIKDRPGRISQCIYFGQPSAELRQRYLSSLLSPYDTAGVFLEKLVEETEGATQAFLKELVFRAVQIASDKACLNPGDKLVIHDEHCRAAITQIRRNSGKSGAGILGFRTN